MAMDRRRLRMILLVCIVSVGVATWILTEPAAVSESPARAPVVGPWDTLHGVAIDAKGKTQFVAVRIAETPDHRKSLSIRIEGLNAVFLEPDLSIGWESLTFRGEVGGMRIEIRCSPGGRYGVLEGELLVAGTKSKLILEQPYTLPVEVFPQATAKGAVVSYAVATAPLRRSSHLPLAYEKPPYDEKPVVFHSAGGKIPFAGVLTSPKGKGPFPAVVFLGGAGPSDCDYSSGGESRPFARLADALTRRGVAVLRVHSRGVCGSGGGHYYQATLDELADDATAAVEFLSAQQGVDPKRVGLLGHSGGGIIAGIVAARRKQTGFVVTLQSPFTSGEAYWIAGIRARASMGGHSREDAEQQVDLRRKLSAVARMECDWGERQRIRRRIASQWLIGRGDLLAATSIKSVNSYACLEDEFPWYRSFLFYDPAENLSRIRCPVLALFGEKDTTVPPDANTPICRAAMRSWDSRSQLAVIPNLGHDLAIGDESDSDESLAPALRERVCDWICSVTAPPRPAKTELPASIPWSIKDADLPPVVD